MPGLSDMGFGCVPPMVRRECWTCLSNMVLGWSDVSAGRAFLTWFIPWSNISVEDDKDLHEG